VPESCFSKNNARRLRTPQKFRTLPHGDFVHGQVTFYVLASIAILSALMMVSRNKTVYSAFYFGLTLLATSGIFLQLRSPLLFIAQLLAVACLLMGVIVFAIEAGKLDVTLSVEHSWRPKVAGLAAAFGLALQIALVLLQRRLLPGERLTELLPRYPLPWALSVADIILFFYAYNLLAFALFMFLLFIAAVGVSTVSQRRA
jgi:NADH:ubiquinone oxidoreductase subunit 6 (subunit J)